ncbi:hypothetical protein [Hymenobacter guriensis]|uniref:VCBS repeat-containing protein n=1 Tax=Hymenobacter guriensis TaxID=2793065 RepID=A0ABS0L0Y9_9BACT|nr:hypothetical protein [Hymenobacter guriensis]MBG8553650.1 hypothetical protein [Hymenobacter guriensis]
MKTPVLTLLGVSLLAATSCDSSRTVGESNNSAAATVESTGSDVVGFSREVTQGDARFDIRATGEGDQQQVTIRSYRGAGLTTDPVRVPIKGTVRDAVSGDLNGNGKPEVYIFTDATSANGGFYGYEFGDRGYTPISSPGQITGAAATGYAGSDTYTLSNGTLTRTFPVTGATSGTATTSTTTGTDAAGTSAAGSTRTVTYKLGADGKWTMNP